MVNTALATKQKFLQRKGLTDQEIQLACEKSGAYALHEQQKSLPPSLPPNLGASAVASPYLPFNQGYQVQLSLFDKIRQIVHNIAIFSIVAYVLHSFYQVVIHWLLFTFLLFHQPFFRNILHHFYLEKRKNR